jgi:hypothetical protein
MRRLPLLIAAVFACAAPAPRADGWRILGPGGGGSLFHPTVSPHDSRTALVACDMTGAYLTHDGGASLTLATPSSSSSSTPRTRA